MARRRKSNSPFRAHFAAALTLSLTVSGLIAINSPQPSSGSTLCAQTFGTPANASVVQVGNDCIITFSGNTTWTVPSGVTSVRLLAVGGGGGGHWDGGGGGGGGAGVTKSGVSVSAGTTASIQIGSGGGQGGPGGTTSIDLDGNSVFEWNAVGGLAGGNFDSRLGGSGGDPVSQNSAQTFVGGRGGNGPEDKWSGKGATNSLLGNGFQSDITGTNLWYGGGGGGGISTHHTGTPSVSSGLTTGINGAPGGYGGGGRGAVMTTRAISDDSPGVQWTYQLNGTTSSFSVSLLAYCWGNTSYPGTTMGFPGLNGTGGGGGGGAAYGDGCSTTGSGNDGERTDGGRGGNGTVIIRYTAPSSPDAIFSAVTPTVDGFTAQIDNFNNSYSWSGTATASGSVTISASGLVTVSGVAANTSSTATVTSSRNGYLDGSGSVSATSLATCSPTTDTSSAPGYTVIKFTSTDTCSWTVPNGLTSVELLVVGGGGAGGSRSGAGGGAGGYIAGTKNVTSGTKLSISVGAGGVGQDRTIHAPNGGNSSILGLASGDLVAIGGGGGGGASGGGVSRSGNTGGSGGGSTPTAAGGENNGAAGTAGQGNAGGGAVAVNVSPFFTNWPSGGGGGAGGAGAAPADNSNGGAGGAGIANSISGVNVCYATGGGGGIYVGLRGGAAGTCSGFGQSVNGGAGTSGSTTPATPTANTGAGGGGAGWSNGDDVNGGSGASGVVIIRYANTAYSVTYNLGSGSGNAPTQSDVSQGASFTVAGASGLSRANHEFSGWSDGTNVYQPGDGYLMGGSNVTLTAQWNLTFLVYESFNNATQTFHNNSGGSDALGFSGNWTDLKTRIKRADATALDGNFYLANNPRMTYPKGTRLNVEALPRALEHPSNGRSTQYSRNLSSPIQLNVDGTYYLTYLLNESASNAAQHMVGLMTSAPTSSSDNNDKSLLFGLGLDATTKSQLAIDYGPSNWMAYCSDSATDSCGATTTTPSYSAKTSKVGGWSSSSGIGYSNLILVKVTASANSADTFQMKMISSTETIPSSDSSITWDLTHTASLSDSFGALTVQSIATSYAGIDEIRIGTTYSSVLAQANCCSVDFLSNGGNAAHSFMPRQAIESGVSTNLRAQTFQKTGATFSGWNTAADGTGTAYSNQDQVTITQDITLYAQWSAATYTITLNKGTSGTGSNQTLTKTHGQALALPNSQTANSYFTRTGYTVSGWTTTDGGSQTHALGANFTTDAATTLYPVWASTLAVTTPTSGLSAIVDQPFTLNISASGGTGTKSYSVTGSLPSGLAIDSATGVISGTPTAAGNSSVTVTVSDSTGSKTTSSFTISVSLIPLGNAATPTVAATAATLKSLSVSWTAVANASSYTLKLYAANGSDLLATITGVSGTSRTITASDYASIADGTTYQVSIQAIGTGNYSSSSESSKASASTLASYTVTFAAGTGATGSNQTLTKTQGQTLVLPDSATANSYFTRTGYTVTGWTTTDGGSQTHALGGNFTTDSGTTLYPVWTANTYNVLFDEKGGSTVNDGTFITGGSVSFPTSPTRAGYTFVGWAATDGGTAVSIPYSPGVTNDITMYAVWSSTLTIATPSSGLSATVGQSFTLNISTSGGSGTNSFTVTGNLPGGLSINSSTGVISGTPTASANFSVTVTVTDSSLASKTTSSFTIAVAIQACSVTPDESSAPGYTVIKFTTAGSCSWSVPNGVSAIDALVVGAGGAGGTSSNGAGGGGGGGQVVSQSSVSVSGTITILVGAGGSPNPTVGTSAAGGNGGSSSLTPGSGTVITARGGSGGDSIKVSETGTPATRGFNGGGGSVWASLRTLGSSGDGGFNGGAAIQSGTDGNVQAGGGGAGAGANGANATSGNGGAGGSGVASSITGSSTTYGGGGGGGKRTSTGTAGTGGAGGGANGGKVANGSNATANTGGGGGGAGGEFVGGSGGSGVVIIRYANTYTITYDVNGATGSPAAATSSYTTSANAATLTTVGTMAKSGYAFAGWSTTDSGSVVAADYKPTSDVTLYAVWTANTFTLTWDVNGGTSVSSSTFQTSGSVSEPSNPTKAGKIFGGWSTSETSNQGDSNNRIGSWPYSPGVTSNVTLYAIWISVAPPIDVEAVPGNASITVNWTAPSTAVSEPPISYRVEYSTTGSGGWTTADAAISSAARTFQITGLTNQTNYYVRVAANYAGATGAYGYPWALIFESTTPNRVADAIVYTTGNGLTGNDVDLTREDFSRVRYYVGAKYSSGDATRLYVDANFEKTITNAGSGSETYSNLYRLQAPVVTGGTNSQFEIHGTVSDLDVISNAATVTGGKGLTGRLEIWPWNYATATQTGLSVGLLDENKYDDGDSWDGGGLYGSFQLHNIGTPKESIFAWNRHFDAASEVEIGFGNNTLYPSSAAVLHPDWTFASQSVSYTTRADFLFQSYANLSVTPTGSFSLTWDSNGGSAVSSPSTFVVGEDISKPTNPTRSGYYFGGWSTSETSNQGDLANRISSWPYVSNTASNLTLHAIWLEDYSLTLSGANGTSARVGISGSPSTVIPNSSSFTWEAWIYPTGVSGTGTTKYATVLDNLDSGNNYGRVWLYVIDAGSGPYLSAGYFSTPPSAGQFEEGRAAATSANSISYNAWNHVAVTYQRTGNAEGSCSLSGGLTVTIYLNGVNVSSSTDSVYSRCLDSIGFSIGDNFDDANQQFKGRIDQVKVWSGVLDQAEIQSSMSNFGSTGVNNTLRAHYSFNELVSSPSSGNTISNLASDAGLYDLTLYSATAGNVATNAGRSLNSFDLAYDGNSETSGSVSSETGLKPYSSVSVAGPGNLAKTGYTFGSWNTLANGSGTNYAESDSYTMLYGNKTLYTKWTADTYTITYDYDNATGGNSNATSTFTSGGAAITLPTPTKNGYTFDGWYEASDFSGSALGSTYSPTSTRTIYAKWDADTYTITYNYNGATGGNSDATDTFTTGGTAITLPTPTKTGYTFDGWYEASDLSGSALGSTYSPTSTRTIYAKWTAATYTITYNYDGATGGNADSTANFTTGGVVITLPTPTKAGYTFGGWYEASDLSGSALGSTYSPTATRTIYAKWNAGTYNVVYEYNGADGGNTTENASYTTGGTAITLPTPTRTGYTFAGWYESSTFSGSALSSPYTTSTNRSVYAKWTAINYTVTYNSDIVVSGNTISATSGSVPTNAMNYNIGQSLVVAGNTGSLARTGYNFAGWVTNEDGSTGTVYNAGDTITFSAANINLYPKWTAATFTISYNKNGASGDLAKASDSYTTGGSSLTLPGGGTMAKTGYFFDGWSETANGVAVAGSGYTTTENKTLFAVWTLQNYNVTYDLNTGSGSAPTTQSTNFQTNVTIAGIGAATKSNHWFAGWNTQANGTGNSYGAGQVLRMPVGGLTLYAVWVPDQYRISYNANGGTGGPDLSASGGFDTATFGVAYSLRDKNNIARTGYTFSHWTTSVDGSGTKYENDGDGSTVLRTFTPATNTVFYAQWTANVYSFSFNSDGGSNSPTNQSKTIGQLITLPSPGNKTGYTFDGWSDGTNKYPTSSSYVVGSSSRNFQAVWIPNVYTVSFDWQGAIGSATSDASYTVGTGNLTLPVLSDQVKDGYTFAGWSESPGGTVLTSFQPTANDVLYAVWNDGNYTLSYDGKGGNVGSGNGTVRRTQSITLPTPVRAGFVFNGWYDSASGGNKIGNGGQSITPASSRSLYARWTQKSLSGVDLATLESGTEYTASDNTAVDTILTHNPTGTSAQVKIPAGALPNGSKVNVQYFRDTARQSNLIPGENSYFFAVLVSWLSGTGDSATVPNTNSGKPIEVTLTNSSIKAGAMAYMVLGTEVRELGRATQDGTITVQLTEDPEIVVAATAPGSPASVVASGGNQQATISWAAPATNGGAQITGYTVTASPGGASCTTATTSCTVTGLTNGTAYTFSVVATNSVGNSAAATSSSVTPALVSYTVTFNSNGGSSVSNGSFASGGSISEPTAPTRSGYTFDGWSTTLNNAASKVTFPYSPGVTTNITLYALWTQVQQSGGGGGSSTPVVTPTPTPGPTPIPTPGPSAPPSQIGFVPTPPATPVAQTGPVGVVKDSGERVTFVADQPGQTLIATVGAVKIEVKPPVVEGASRPVTEKLELVFPVASQASLSGSGLQPNTVVEAWVFSEPTYVGTIKVGPTGAFDTNLALPKNLLPGQHTLQIGTINSSGRLVTLSMPITIKGTVSVGTFRGFIAIYSTGLEGQEITAKVAGKWIRQNPVKRFKNFQYSRLVRFTGAGYNIKIDVYINKKFYKRFTTKTR